MDDSVVKTGMLLGLVVVAGAAAWISDAPVGAVLGAAVIGLVLALVNIFKRQVVPALVVLYAGFEGFFVGGISHYYNSAYPGIALQAAVGTAVIFGGVLFAFTSGKLKATPQFTKMVTGAFFGLFGLVILNLLVSAFAGGDGLGLRSGGGISILFSVVFIAVGSMTFVLDFDRAQKMVDAGVDERESWRIAFGLIVGLVWLYLEVLRLLSYLNRR
jgi:uncharacterized YccA/Bax inhibitor family protein